MPNPASTLVGEVEELWRYPVKSMLGEKLITTDVTKKRPLSRIARTAARHFRRQDRNREDCAEMAEPVRLRGRADWCC